MGSVYKLDFSSGLSYIGATKQKLSDRIRRHELAALNGRKNYAVHKAWREFGKPVVILLSETADEDLPFAEMQAIAKFGTMVPNGYNLTSGGRKTRFSAGTNEARAIALRGRVFSEASKEKMSKAQRNRDQSTRYYLGPIWEGRKQSPDHIEKRIRKAGWKHSEETKAKLSAMASGRVMKPQTKLKISNTLKSAKKLAI